jgi:hypothetical protein
VLSIASRLAAAVLLAGLLLAEQAAAHPIGLSRSEFTLEASGDVQGLLVFSKSDAVELGHVDADRDGVVSPDELARSEIVFRDVVERGVVLTADGARCKGTVLGGGDVEGDAFGLSLDLACPAHPRVLEVDLALLGEMPPGHRHALRMRAGVQTVEKLLTAEDRVASLVLTEPDAPATAPRRELGSIFSAALEMGVLHILSGWDHLMFLLALLLGARTLKNVALAVTAFTAAHSVTLAIVVLGAWVPSPRWVEPAIAASIALVAFGNVASPAPRPRWKSAFLFGLLHGLGFAGALRALGVAHTSLVPTLLGFNAGVELGQIAIVAFILAIVSRIRQLHAREARWISGLSLGLGLLGAALCVMRIAEG